MSVIDDLLAKKPEIRVARLCLDPELARALGEADQALAQARHALTLENAGHEQAAALEAAQAVYDEALVAVQGALASFTFQSISPEAFDDLKKKHRPTEAQRTEAKKIGQPVPEWNVDTFAPGLIALACVKVETPSGSQPGLTVEDAGAVWNSPVYNQAERGELYNAALSAYVNRTRLVEFPPKAG